jgi:hypothetical protein
MPTMAKAPNKRHVPAFTSIIKSVHRKGYERLSRVGRVWAKGKEVEMVEPRAVRQKKHRHGVTVSRQEPDCGQCHEIRVVV